MSKKQKQQRLKLKPSTRDKRRYFIVDATNERVEKVILEYVGVLGFAKSAYMPVKVEGISKTVGSCLVGSLEEVRAGLGLSGIKIEKVSGTIKGLS